MLLKDQSFRNRSHYGYRRNKFEVNILNKFALTIAFFQKKEYLGPRPPRAHPMVDFVLTVYFKKCYLLHIIAVKCKEN